MAPFPDWTAGASHMRSPLVDLMSYRSGDYWYRSRVGGGGPGTSSRDVVFVSLYPQDQRVVHDLTDRIGKAASAPGSAPLRVVFIYNKPFQVPVSRFGEEVEIESLFESFYSDGIELTPVPRWEAGDYHVEVSFEDLEEQFNIPETGAIDPDRYAQLKSELQRHGFDRDPVKITLLRGGEGDRQGENGTRGNRWLDQADRIRVARDLGMDGFPTVMFYNSLNRQECGAVPACYERLCESAVCAGADPSVCSEPAIDRSGGRPNVVPIINPTTLVSPS